MSGNVGGRRWAIAVAGSRILVRVSRRGLRLPTEDELTEALDHLDVRPTPIPARIAVAGARQARAFAIDEEVEPPDGFRLEGLRFAYHALSPAEFRAAGTARQKVQWYRSHVFCSACGAGTTKDDAHEAMRCTACGQLHFPRVAPAVIVLVERDGEALLARSPRFPEGVYSTLAGFVEPGESLEECAHREIREEVGVEIAGLRYFGSQPHPFPHSLMIGFVADWLSGEIRIDEVEIEDAGWFTPDGLPELPHPMSIARALIEDFANRHRA